MSDAIVVLTVIVGVGFGVILHELTHAVACLPWCRPTGAGLIYEKTPWLPSAVFLSHPPVDHPWDKVITLAPAIWVLPLGVDLPAFLLWAALMAAIGTIGDAINLIKPGVFGLRKAKKLYLIGGPHES